MKGGRRRTRVTHAATALAVALAVAPAPSTARAMGWRQATPAQADAPRTPEEGGKRKGTPVRAAGGGPTAARRTGPLFESHAPLRLTLTADFGDVFKGRDTLRARPRRARLAYQPEGAGAPRALPVTLTTRGHYRLKPTTCPFAPLRVTFDSGGTKDTPFARQRALKLTTHCRSGSREFEQNVLREYLAYRVYNLLTDRSFRVRLARITYAEARDTTKGVTSYGFFVESERELGRRLGARPLEARGGRFEDFDPAQTDLLSVFEYMIGNTDYSIWALHNVRIYAAAGRYVPVPYDFDWSGVVSARYAFPDPRLGTRTVRERLYRGPCRTAEQLAPTFARFVAMRDSISALYRTLPDLEPAYVKDMERYFAEFYRDIGDPARWRAAAGGTCREAQ